MRSSKSSPRLVRHSNDRRLRPWLMLMDPGERGRGLGGAAYGAFERWVASEGGDSMLLAVLERNDRAARFWERLGLGWPHSYPERAIGTRRHVLAEDVQSCPNRRNAPIRERGWPIMYRRTERRGRIRCLIEQALYVTVWRRGFSRDSQYWKRALHQGLCASLRGYTKRITHHVLFPTIFKDRVCDIICFVVSALG